MGREATPRRPRSSGRDGPAHGPEGLTGTCAAPRRAWWRGFRARCPAGWTPWRRGLAGRPRRDAHPTSCGADPSGDPGGAGETGGQLHPSGLRRPGAGRTRLCAGPHLCRRHGRSGRVVARAVKGLRAGWLSAGWRNAGRISRWGGAPLCCLGAACLAQEMYFTSDYGSRMKRPWWSLRLGFRLRWRVLALKIVKGRTKAPIVVTGWCRAIQRDLPAGPGSPRAPGVGRRGRAAPAPAVSAAPQQAAPPCARRIAISTMTRSTFTRL